jgi:hypothetical protein
MAASDPAGCHPTASHGAVLTNCFHRIRAAGGGESAVRGEERADETAVDLDRGDQHECQRTPARGVVAAAPVRCHARARSDVTARSSAASSSCASAAPDKVAAGGRTRSTTRADDGRPSSLAAIRWRSRRRTLLRVTALPTARLTTKPTRGAAVGASSSGLSGLSSGGATSRCTTRDGRAPRRPYRTTAVISGR